MNNPLLDCHWRASSTVAKALAVSGISIGDESMLLNLPALNVSCEKSKLHKAHFANFW
jgi:hypothetical protein